MGTNKLTCVAMIMAGGAGTRFWPLSRNRRPKQLLPLLGAKSMIRATVDRLRPLFSPERIYVITGIEHGGEIRRELPELPPDNIIDEPVGRDTAPCVGLACVVAEHYEGRSVICALPADHDIGDRRKFHSDLRIARGIAEDGKVATFGINPTHPATGFGYIERGDAIRKGERVFRLRRFCEKPTVARARQFLRSGRYLWNSGMFVFRSDVMRDAILEHLPDVAGALDRISQYYGTGEQDRVMRKEYERFPRISIDYGVMEKLREAVVIKASFPWDDVGSWDAVMARAPRDASGNAARGLHCGIDTRDCRIYADGKRMVATIGIRDLLVVSTEDAVLIASAKSSGRLKEIVARLKNTGRTDLL